MLCFTIQEEEKYLFEIESEKLMQLALKEQDEQRTARLLALKKDMTIEEHLDHLNVCKKWE